MSGKINVVLVDDEPGCLMNLQHYLEVYCPQIRILGVASDIDTAAELLRKPGVQLAFLDVQLFDRTVFELLSAAGIPEIPVVFVTAYEKYALSALRVSALDYLMKPLELAEIQRCYARILKHFEPQLAASPELSPKAGRILLRQGERVYPTSGENLLFLHAQGFYTNVAFLHEGKVRELIVSKPINVLHEEWHAPFLMRVHRSYVINTNHVRSLRRSGTSLSVQIGDQFIPVAKRRSAEFLEKYNG